jgi:Xaa-Pro aminopeptidase
LAAFIASDSDPHNSEYVPEHWKCREWISGFNGSAGTIVVTMESAALWTDSRYFIAAAQQLQGTGIELMKLRMAGTPSIAEWIGKQLSSSSSTEIGIDGMVTPYATIENLTAELRHQGGITVRTNLDPFKEIWTNRPALPAEKVIRQPLEYAGETTTSKLQRIRKSLRDKHADGILISSLDDIAWTLNLRGNDVHCNPVFVSYLLISTTKATLFIAPEKLTTEIKDYLKEQGIGTDDYKNVTKGIANYEDYNILLDTSETNYTLSKAIQSHHTIMAQSPVPTMKSVKNEVEIEGFHNAMLRDGIALVKFLRWLKPVVEHGGQTELSISDKLLELRQAQPLFCDISFDTIVGYEEHGAIVHYEPTPETDVPVLPHGLVLIDSGAQYQDGTTDITRTIALGPITEQQRHVYTLVLKAHIQLELVKFPSGACGSQIDALSREPLWREGLNFFHGTGHGVGSYLNVHEGPHQIRMEWIPAPLVDGMTVTDEPGIYIEGAFGVRTENVLLTREYKKTDFGDFLQFEPLTLCPIDTAPIDLSMLTDEELSWLNDYHKTVYDKLSPHLNYDEKEWLKEATKPLSK